MPNQTVSVEEILEDLESFEKGYGSYLFSILFFFSDLEPVGSGPSLPQLMEVSVIFNITFILFAACIMCYVHICLIVTNMLCLP